MSGIGLAHDLLILGVMNDLTLEQKNGETEIRTFEFQKWPVYEKSLAFVAEAYKLCGELPKDSATGLRDQLRRASQSIPLNIAEGTSMFSQKEKANYWRIAKGSVFECVAVIDLVRRLGLVTKDIGLFTKIWRPLAECFRG